VVTEESYCHSSYQSPELYGDWEENNSYSISGVKVVDDDYKTSYGEEGYIIPDDSEFAYVIHMNYDTGNSFGRSTGNGAILGVFGKSEVATAAMKTIQEQVKKEEYSIKVQDDFGNAISIHNPGAGYFESVNYVDLTGYKLNSINERVEF
jgi:hypothetical protein